MLEEKVIRYNTVVWATLATTTSEVVLASDIYTGNVDNRYRVILKFNLSVVEYLQGSGPTNITALWLDGIKYETRAKAETKRDAIVQKQDTQWDDERAIIFLVGNHGGNVEAFGTALTELLQRDDHFFLGSEDRYSSDDRYSLHSRSRVAWFPEQRPRIEADGHYMMTLPPDSQTISLSALKQRIAEVTAELARVDSEEYRECVVKKYEHMRRTRNWPVERGRGVYQLGPRRRRRVRPTCGHRDQPAWLPQPIPGPASHVAGRHGLVLVQRLHRTIDRGIGRGRDHQHRETDAGRRVFV